MSRSLWPPGTLSSMPASPSDESLADVLAVARAYAAPGQEVHPGTRIDALEHLGAPGAWLGLFIWAGLPDIVDGPQPPSFEPPETLADAARILDAVDSAFAHEPTVRGQRGSVRARCHRARGGARSRP